MNKPNLKYYEFDGSTRLSYGVRELLVRNNLNVLAMELLGTKRDFSIVDYRGEIYRAAGIPCNGHYQHLPVRQCLNCNTWYYPHTHSEFCSVDECIVAERDRGILEDDYYEN